MDSPFFRNHYRSVPVQPPVHRKASPKVVSIPVHFVSSEAKQSVTSRPEAAVKIQRVFRGFRVRKCLKKIASIRNEVYEIEARISSKEVVELIRKDAKEKLRVNETLMSLLFKLDSIRGFDSGVRDLRKAVTKKAIALQEKVDLISQNLDVVENDFGMLDEAVIDHYQEIQDCSTLDDKVKEAENLDLGSCNSSSDCRNRSEGVAVDDSGKTEFNYEDYEFVGNPEGDEENCVTKEVIEEAMDDCAEESVETTPGNGLNEIGKENKAGDSMEVKKSAVGDDLSRDDNKRNIELLEKMIVENEKMMSMMKQIFDRNEAQMKMLNSLSQRVELLEKAFICDKLRRKKKKNSA